ncbi:MAG: gliding motility-associated C-terminal domain-containing protein [Microscillaceae bacterium]|jgi:hypothetical protein|nr:gliding motility-associated C-terminal domain-containing protein [Microscillaceae bacterium]
MLKKTITALIACISRLHSLPNLYLYNWRGIILLVFALLATPKLWATHIIAGEITAVLQDPAANRRYCFRVVIYTDPTSPADSPTLEVNFGDNTRATAQRINGNGVIIAPGIKYNIYEVCHTYVANGSFLVSFLEANRIDRIANVGNSVNTPFSLQTFVLVNPAIGINRTPSLRVAPLDVACPGQKFFHNAGAFDLDGDSLVFRIVPPRQSVDRTVDYTDPTRVFPGGTEGDPNLPPTLKMDPRTGDIVWDSPAKQDEDRIYNIAFVVEEWRNGIRIGYITRDMQIRVLRNCENKRPILTVPDVCAIVGEQNVNATISAFDQNTERNPLDEVVLSSPFADASNLQGIFDPNPATGIGNPIAVFTSASGQRGTATGTLTWNPSCAQVREQPYIVVFKAQDNPRETPLSGRSLVDIQSMLITVKGPRPTNLQATLGTNRSVNLTWNSYTSICNNFSQPELDRMQILVWRREGCIPKLVCGESPEQMGYTRIATRPITATNYNDVGPLAIGLSYSYIITVNFPPPRRGESQASEPQCVVVPIVIPLITNVTVNETNLTPTPATGSVTVNWLKALELPATVKPPFRYQLQRAEGLNGTNYTTIYTVDDPTGNTQEFTFTDNNLNTRDNALIYRVRWFSEVGTANQAEQTRSDSATTVRLTATGADNSVILTWDYRVPWSNQNRYHRIYRAKVGQPKNALQLIDSVLVGQNRYVDIGKLECLDPNTNYFYYVQTRGSYNNALIPTKFNLLRNDSQIAAAQPIDNTPPPPPVLFLDTTRCSATLDVNNIKNKLTWQPNKQGTDCQKEISTYRVYFKSTLDGNYALLPNPPLGQPYKDTTFTHTRNFLPTTPDGAVSQAGCYYVTAVDRNGNESQPSNEVCQENCFNFVLPNVFTPGSSPGKNDLFRPMENPPARYIRSIVFTVYNRLGNKVFERENDPLINWDGTGADGKPLPNGVYYCEAKVNFYALNPANAVQTFNNWVTITR